MRDNSTEKERLIPVTDLKEGWIPMKSKVKIYFLLHIFLMFYSICGIVSKLAAGEPFLSLRFCFLYGIEIFILGCYAIGWQQFIKRMPLTAAYANKAVSVVWGCIWGVLIFDEHLTAGKLLGVFLVVAGVVLFALSDQERQEDFDE